MLYKLTVAYEGTHYQGWQIQSNAISIQDHIEKVLKRITGESIRISGSGRTDTGVHALGQIAHFNSSKELDVERALFSLNSLLPKDIRILSLEMLSTPFHARHHAKSKIYRYHLCLDKVVSPFKRAYVWHIPYALDLTRLQTAIDYFLGTHDFTSFTNEAHKGTAFINPIRTIFRIDIIQEEGGIALEFEGDGFLYKMVRNIVGMLVDCASFKKEPSMIPEVLKAKNRTKASRAAPAQGLFLVKVIY